MVEATEVRVQMTEARRRRLVLLARLLSTFTVLSVLIGLWLSTIDQAPTDVGLLLAFALFPIVGYLMATRRPDNSLSWIMVGIGVAIGVGGSSVRTGATPFTAASAVAPRTHRGVVRQPDVGAGRGPTRDVPPVVVPGRTSPLSALAMVRTHPGREHGIVYLTIVLAPGKFGDEAGRSRTTGTRSAWRRSARCSRSRSSASPCSRSG